MSTRNARHTGTAPETQLNLEITMRLDSAPQRPIEPPPPPPPPPRQQLDTAVRQPALHQGQADAPPPERYVQHEVAPGETVTELATRYQTTAPMLGAANPQANLNQVDVGQKLNVPIGHGYGEVPTPATVAPGQTLTEMAKDRRLPLNVVAAANGLSLANASLIRPGQVLQLPVDQPNTTLEDRVQATDKTLATLQRAERDQAAANNMYLAERLGPNVNAARTAFQSATEAELNERARLATPFGNSPNEEAYVAAGEAIKARYVASPKETAKLDQALHALKVTRDANAEIQAAKAGGSADKQLALLGTNLKSATPEVRDAVLSSAEGQAIVQRGADWAMASLKGGDAEKAWDSAQNEGAFSPAWSGNKAMGRLKQATQDLDPELAAQVTAAAIPTLERYTNGFREKFGGSMVGSDATVALQQVLDRSADTTTGRSNLQRMASLGTGDFIGVYEHIAQGGSTAYGVALAQSGKVNADMVLGNVYAGVQAQRDKIAETAKSYGEHFEEMGWLVANHGGSMTPEQLQKAIEDYTREKGPEWEQKGKDLQNQLAIQGEQLQAQLTGLGQLPAGTYGRDAAIADAMNDPVASLALNTAWEKNPALLQGARGNSVLDFFADPTVKGSARLTDVGRRLISGGAMAWMKHNTGQALGNFNPNNPASVQSAKAALEGLRNGSLVKLLGVSTGEMDKAIDAMKSAMPAAGDTAEQITAKMKTLSGELDTIGGNIKGRYGFDPSTANEGQVAFSRSTLSGQLMRGVGVMLGGIGLAASTNAAIDDPSLKNWLKVTSDTLGLTQRGLELSVGVFKLDQGTSLAAKAGTKAGSFLAGRVLGAVSAVFDVWSGIEAAGKGDYVSAGLYGAGAGGTVMAALFTGPVGWAGLAIVGISAAGLWVWNSKKEADKHEPDSDGGASMRFLQHAGLNESTARALTNQSGDGHSPVALLSRYAELKGYDLSTAQDQQKFTEWLNGMPSDKLGAMRDNLHHTLDKVDGDVSKFSATATDDATEVADTQQRPWFSRSGSESPMTIAQLEAVLGVLQLSALPSP